MAHSNWKCPIEIKLKGPFDTLRKKLSQSLLTVWFSQNSHIVLLNYYFTWLYRYNVNLVKYSYNCKNSCVYMVMIYGLVAFTCQFFANRTPLGHSWAPRKSKSWCHFYTGNEACTSCRMACETSGSDTNINSVKGDAQRTWGGHTQY